MKSLLKVSRIKEMAHKAGLDINKRTILKIDRRLRKQLENAIRTKAQVTLSLSFDDIMNGEKETA